MSSSTGTPQNMAFIVLNELGALVKYTAAILFSPHRIVARGRSAF